MRVACAHDCGQIIAPDGVRAQVEGCILQTISRALFEEVKFDRKLVTSTDWVTYPILKIPDAPALDIALIDRPNEPPMGVGEASTSPMRQAPGEAFHANAPDADAEGRRPAALRVETHSLRSWGQGWLGVRADAEEDWRAWLGLPEQALLEVTEGSVYHDDDGELGRSAPSASPIFRTTFGSTRLPANVRASNRSGRSLVGAAMSATTLARAHRCATSCR